ncbi:pectinacetylesterase domain protein [Leptospira ryugenii]|uniref:Pectinacetylesterase domain protein n=1 Tax=Leptospira ryugenii TaxID=1917863 RepID=A0A2P2DVR8_9LEPT|nr:pectin acetylesterase-family hydrolase [Leptospira ryugenii]GBF48714.1 pectinacetylesterase domain protein [Leptospira ryugenii]
MKIRTSITVLSVVLSLASCKKEKDNDDKELLALGLLAALQTPYIGITPTRGSITIGGNANRTITYDPKCTGVSGNQTFKFYLKKGTSKNLLVNFMGGGACWDGKNCFGSNTTTYFNRMEILSELAVRLAFNGILEERNANNPFKDWNVLFIPYCSGDLFWGSKATTYTDPTTNTATTLQHRGFDNFLASIDYVSKTTDWKPGTGDKIFVTGQSAGAYGAIYNFPYIKEIFPNNEVNVLGDAGAGVIPTNFQAQGPVDKWGADANVPTWVGVSSTSFATIQLGDFYKQVANFYPSSRVAQYTTNFDGNQRYFFNVQKRIQANVSYTNSTDLWGKSDGSQVDDSTSCTWVTEARTNIITRSGQSSNFRYYIAGGDVHTITTSANFYTESSGGSSLLTWLRGMLANNSDWVNRDCKSIGNCSPPATASSPSGISCSF